MLSAATSLTSLLRVVLETDERFGKLYMLRGILIEVIESSSHSRYLVSVEGYREGV